MKLMEFRVYRRIVTEHWRMIVDLLPLPWMWPMSSTDVRAAPGVTKTANHEAVGCLPRNGVVGSAVGVPRIPKLTGRSRLPGPLGVPSAWKERARPLHAVCQFLISCERLESMGAGDTKPMVRLDS